MYVPDRSFSGRDSFSFLANDGSLEGENTGNVSVVVVAAVEEVWAGNMELYVSAASTTRIELLQSLPASLRSESRPGTYWQISRLPTEGRLSLEEYPASGGFDGNDAVADVLSAPHDISSQTQTHVYFRSRDAVRGAPVSTAFGYPQHPREGGGVHGAGDCEQCQGPSSFESPFELSY